jgi:hypothetical protein
MAGRKLRWRIAACEAVLRGEDTVTCFNKTGPIKAWLTADQIANAKATLDTLKSQQPPKPAPTPKLDLPKEPIPPKDTDYKPKGDVCFIIANGESRRGFDLNTLKHKGYIIGMNVLPLREDFWPDALISVDIATVNYICANNVPDKLEMWTYPRNKITDQRVKRIAKDWGWSSGPTATRIALEYKKFQTIYILGMDFYGLNNDGKVGGDKDGKKLNNMYKGTERYRKANSDRTYFGNWLNQMTTNVTQHSHVNFYHVVLDNQKSPNKIAQKKNWIDITYSNFQQHLEKMPKKES